jgi:pilus assembly protein CpaF
MPSRIDIAVMRGAELLAERSFPPGARVIVGRAAEADVVLEGREISRRHVRIDAVEGGFRIEDLSLNGIGCDGRPVLPGELLRFGAALEIGPYTVAVRAPDAASDEVCAAEARRHIRARLIENVDLSVVDKSADDLRPRVEAALGRLAHEARLPAAVDVPALISDLADEALGLGPIERLLRDDGVSEIMVVDPGSVYVERQGTLVKTDLAFTSAESLHTVIERIITPLGRRIDESSPMVDARLKDGSRVNAVIPPIAIRGPCVTIRKFGKTPLTLARLVELGSLDAAMAGFLAAAVIARRNVVISGGTGSGKTTLLNALAGEIRADERIVTIEDAAELRLPQPHVVPLETRPPNAEGRGAITIRDLVRNALRMRPDRIVVGECRGSEAIDMLQAMNTGHDGSLTTTHANSPAEAIGRLETLCLMAGLDLPSRAVREQIAAAVHLIVQQSRLASGARRVTAIAEVVGMEDDGRVALRDVFRHVGETEGRLGAFQATGWLPEFVRARATGELST